MKKFRNILYIFVFAGNLFGQTLTVDLDPIGNVVVGGGLNISGRVTHDGVSPPITAGSPVQLDIFVEDPSGFGFCQIPRLFLLLVLIKVVLKHSALLFQCLGARIINGRQAEIG